MSDVPEEETAVIKEKVTAFEGFFIPQNGDGQSFFAKIVIGCCGDLADSFCQAHGGGKETVFSGGFPAVDGDLGLRGGKAFHFDLKVIFSFDAVVAVQNGAVP